MSGRGNRTVRQAAPPPIKISRSTTSSAQKKPRSAAADFSVIGSGDYAPLQVPRSGSAPAIERVVVVNESASPVVLKRSELTIIAADTKAMQDSLPLKQLSKITFGTWSTEQLQQYEFPALTSPSGGGVGSIGDPRLGTNDGSRNCSTCRLDYQQCLGHFGYIKLALPVIHPLHTGRVLKVLSCVCNTCGMLLMSPESVRILKIDRASGEERLNLLLSPSVGLLCRRHDHDVMPSNRGEGQVKKCEPNPVFLPKKTAANGVVMFRSGGRASKVGEPSSMSTAKVLSLLHQVSDADAALLGFGHGQHPRSLVLTSLVVLPPGVRPPSEGDQPKVDFIDIVYNRIIALNSHVRPTDPPHVLDDYQVKLVGLVGFLFGTQGDEPKLSKLVGQVPKEWMSYKARVHGKERSIFKHLLLGKRADFTARMVSGPGPYLPFGYVGFPISQRHRFTFKIVVFSANLKHVQQLVRSGEIVRVRHSAGLRKGLSITLIDEHGNRDHAKCIGTVVSFGDTVYRCLQNGDPVAVNRQPTLYRYSMMGHRFVLVDSTNLQLPLSVTSPYNLDFDGDEQTVHLPQTDEARAEIEGVMNVRSMVMSSEATRPMMSLVMDGVSGFFKATSRCIDLSIAEWTNAVAHLPSCGMGSESYASLFERAKRHRVRWLSSRMLMSVVFPDDFNYDGADGVRIREGIIVRGALSSRHVGRAHYNVVHAMWMTVGGASKVTRFLTEAAWLVDMFLRCRPISVGIDDLLVNAEGHAMVGEEVVRARLTVERLTELSRDATAGRRDVSSLSKQLDDARLESEITTQLNRAANIGERVLKRSVLSGDNQLALMVNAGSKGSGADIGGLCVLVGNQYRRGKRILPTKGRRVPSFEPGTRDPRAAGFIGSSYFAGLTGPEMFFNAVASREGLIDTVHQTADCGSLDRRLRSTNINVTNHHDGSIRTKAIAIRTDATSRFTAVTAGRIVLPLYGMDGLATEHCKQVCFTSSDPDEARRGGIAASVDVLEGTTFTFFVDIDAVTVSLNAMHGF